MLCAMPSATEASAFTVADLYPINPTNFAYGNAGRNLLHGPGSETVNLSVFKNFPIREKANLQLRFEAYNAFNHTQFSGMNTTAQFNPATGHVDMDVSVTTEAIVRDQTIQSREVVGIDEV